MIKVKGEVRPQSPDTEYMYISIMVRLSIKGWPLLAELSLADVESLVSMMLQKISNNRVLYQVKEVALTAHGASE